MREILFRGRRNFNKEWVYGSLVNVGDFCGIVEKDQTRLHAMDQVYLDKDTGVIDGHATRVPLETVGQYIGYTDKNGKKIFEGDIITYSVGEEVDPEIALIEYDGASFVYQTALERSKNIGGTCIDDHNYWVAISDCECIGNIHDNPELLEVKEDAAARQRSIF